MPASPDAAATGRTIWADADSLQPEIRDLLERRAASEAALSAAREARPRFTLVFVAAKRMRHGAATTFILVEPGRGASDDRIASLAAPGDIAVTRDTALAERLALAGVIVLNDRGEVLAADLARERRSLRDRAQELRDLGLAPPPSRARLWGRGEFRNFADCLDRALAKLPG